MTSEINYFPFRYQTARCLFLYISCGPIGPLYIFFWILITWLCHVLSISYLCMLFIFYLCGILCSAEVCKWDTMTFIILWLLLCLVFLPCLRNFFLFLIKVVAFSMIAPLIYLEFIFVYGLNKGSNFRFFLYETSMILISFISQSFLSPLLCSVASILYPFNAYLNY